MVSQWLVRHTYKFIKEMDSVARTMSVRIDDLGDAEAVTGGDPNLNPICNYTDNYISLQEYIQRVSK